jgi:hypothetical protein
MIKIHTKELATQTQNIAIFVETKNYKNLFSL